MRGHEIDARRRRTAGGLIEIGTACEASRDVRMQPHVALPKLAHRVAILAVPFHPSQWKIADLIAALAEIPGLGDQFGRRKRGVLVDRVEESAQLIDIV